MTLLHAVSKQRSENKADSVIVPIPPPDVFFLPDTHFVTKTILSLGRRVRELYNGHCCGGDPSALVPHGRILLAMVGDRQSLRFLMCFVHVAKWRSGSVVGP